jgi:hypothetical protein
MGHWLVIAQGGDHLSRAADHAAVLGVVALIAVVGGLVYGVVRFVGRSRADRRRSDHGPPEAPGGPEA